MNRCPRCGRRDAFGWHRCDPQLQPLRVPVGRTPAGRPIPRAAPPRPVPPARRPVPIPTPGRPGPGRVGRPPAPPPLGGAGGLPGFPGRDQPDATVATRPVVIGGGGGIDAALGTLTMLLMLVTVLVTPALLMMALFVLMIFLIIGWGLGRIGMLWPLMFLRAGGRRRDTPARPTLAFRCDDGHRLREVRIYGHETGVSLGDSVRVHGPSIGGVVHAWSIANRTTGVVLRRRGRIRVIAMLVCDAWMALGILSILAAS